MFKKPIQLLQSNMALPRKHRKALNEFYQKHGVGGTKELRLAFWHSLYDGVGYSHNPTDAQKVRINELSWCFDNFPQDFISC
jgi:hypothetical protein